LWGRAGGAPDYWQHSGKGRSDTASTCRPLRSSGVLSNTRGDAFRFARRTFTPSGTFTNPGTSLRWRSIGDWRVIWATVERQASGLRAQEPCRLRANAWDCGDASSAGWGYGTAALEFRREGHCQPEDAGRGRPTVEVQDVLRLPGTRQADSFAPHARHPPPAHAIAERVAPDSAGAVHCSSVADVLQWPYPKEKR
jgi:hypothetical protein